MEFPDRLAVKLWIIDNALGKRNLERYDRILLEDKKRDVLAEQARQKKADGNAKGGSKSRKNSCESNFSERDYKKERENKTDYKIAKAADTSEDTVRKVRMIEKYGSPELKEQVRNKEVSINKAGMQAAFFLLRFRADQDREHGQMVGRCRFVFVWNAYLFHFELSTDYPQKTQCGLYAACNPLQKTS